MTRLADVATRNYGNRWLQNYIGYPISLDYHCLNEQAETHLWTKCWKMLMLPQGHSGRAMCSDVKNRFRFQKMTYHNNNRAQKWYPAFTSRYCPNSSHEECYSTECCQMVMEYQACSTNILHRTGWFLQYLIRHVMGSHLTQSASLHVSSVK